ncbi:hypothetical protein BAUCODRAFT_33009 [Baudoinia panamericana UAMH 10762]|uniref:Uncharacterized protein n=1 Tax=Baudoinia panamericana (strain UAMH 10762) TaxID=717646 RepID=M2NE93_BAUPA|nr:uncharacterized protein BAUCODRAFT_33009 [Baudoinia panamericana UAMH 10762]EMC97275.1 hypothetical protein BAUCODRAFT_33009 [Baudoinia panamericana UAMH 10762]
MTQADFEVWKEAGPGTWRPHRPRIIIVEKGDVLLMPPGVAIIHAPLTLETCVMEGSMIWDRQRLVDIRRNCMWIAQNESVTNEPRLGDLDNVLATAIEDEARRGDSAGR